MKISRKKANEVIKKILGHIPKESIENEYSFEFYSGIIKVSIFKNIEEYQNSKEYKYFEIYDDKENKYVKYNGPSITAHIYIQNESKEIIKMNIKNLEMISFEYNESLEESYMELE